METGQTCAVAMSLGFRSVRYFYDLHLLKKPPLRQKKKKKKNKTRDYIYIYIYIRIYIYMCVYLTYKDDNPCIAIFQAEHFHFFGAVLKQIVDFGFLGSGLRVPNYLSGLRVAFLQPYKPSLGPSLHTLLWVIPTKKGSYYKTVGKKSLR